MAQLMAVLLLLSITQAAQPQRATSKVLGAVGGVAYLSPRKQALVSYQEIQWRYRNLVKIASRDGKDHVEYPNSLYQGRLELFPNNTLKISSLRKNDSSMYWVYLEDEEGSVHMESVLLEVHDVVPKPNVSAKVLKDDPAGCEATLECSVGLEGVTYEWIPPSKLRLEAAGPASELHVSFVPSEETYTCKVSNPVSSNNASLTYRHPCSWTGESSTATSRATLTVLMALGHLLLLLLLLSVA